MSNLSFSLAQSLSFINYYKLLKEKYTLKIDFIFYYFANFFLVKHTNKKTDRSTTMTFRRSIISLI